MVIPRDGFFYPILTPLIDSFCFCSQSNTAFLCVKERRLSEVPEYAVMQHNMMVSLKHSNDVNCLPKCGCWIFIFPTDVR